MMWKKYQSIPLIYKMIAGMLAGILLAGSWGRGQNFLLPLASFS